MKILIVGSGGREHALAWKVAQSPLARHIYVAPGNAGTALERPCGSTRIENVAINATHISQLVEFSLSQHIDLTLVGPEVPLVNGIVDAFQASGLRILGPSQAAAQLEGSKVFMKAFVKRHAIPSADACTFTELPAACHYLRQQLQQAPARRIVIKADGLAAGKGVVVANTLAEAEAAATAMLSGTAFGDAGRQILVEEFLNGEEASFMVITDGTNLLPLATSQDHKTIGEGDQGANTGGMGAYSPAPVVTEAVHQRIMQEIIWPTVRGMALEGIPYSGFLYAGLMILPDGTPKVIEFNCRLGDPETQAILLRLRSDLVALTLAATNGQLHQQIIEWDPGAALGVVLAAGGYPDTYQKGEVISGLPSSIAIDSVTGNPAIKQKVFHSGTCLAGDQVVTQGGRVVCTAALGETLADAQRHAYDLAQRIYWKNIYYRRDIGHRALGAVGGSHS